MPPPPPPPPSRRDAKASAASKEENIYIPSFISKRPFYAGEESADQNDYLEHQRLQKKDAQTQSLSSAVWYERGKKAGPAATKFRKGACENCGAMTHKAADCLSRPRAKGARWTGRDIQADEVVQDVQLGWDAKRDRWNGYDAREYRHVVDDYNAMEEMRRAAQAKAAQERREAEGEDDEEDGEDGAPQDDGDHYAEESDMSRHQPTSTRQLRIREDTAKYLLNLDLESAKYDPKTRTLVDAGATADTAAQLFAEEGFLRGAGEAADFERAQRYAWEAQERSGDTRQHLQANPTAGEFHRKKELEEAARMKAKREKMLADKYGAAEASQAPAALRDMAAAVTESENYVEYDEAGFIKGAPKKTTRSKYPEDVMINNHSSVWGSWWSNFKWGYVCCHSFIKNSYCTGEEGKAAWEAAERQRTGVGLLEEGSRDDDEPAEKEDVAEPEKPEATASSTAKKRGAGEMLNGITEEELEEYRRKRKVADDPMAKFLGKDELVR